MQIFAFMKKSPTVNVSEEIFRTPSLTYKNDHSEVFCKNGVLKKS